MGGPRVMADPQSSPWLFQTKTGWWFGTFGLFVYSVGNVIIPTDELIFFRGLETSFHNTWDVILPIDELHHFLRW